MNPFLNNLICRLQSNDPTLSSTLACRRLPLWQVTLADILALVCALSDNHVVTSLDLWIPGADERDSASVDYMTLQSALSGNSTLRRLVVSSCETQQAWHAILKGIARNTSIRHLELGETVLCSDDDGHVDHEVDGHFHSMENSAGKLLGEVLRRHPLLELVTLRGFSISTESAHCISQSLCTRNILHTLELHQVKMDPGAWAEMFLACRSHIQNLRIIESAIGMCATHSRDHQLAHFLTNNETLCSLRLIGCHIGESELEALATGMQASSNNIKVLDLRDNHIADDAGPALGTLLRHGRLERLLLEDNAIGYRGIRWLSGGLTSHPTLCHLNLRGNHLTIEAGTILAEIVPTTQLEVLDISENDWGDAGVIALGAMLNTSRVQELHLERSLVGESGIESLCRVLRHNSVLRILNLSRNRLTEIDAGSMVAMLRQNRSLKQLNLSSCHISNEALGVLAHALPETSLTSLSLGWNSFGNAGCEALAAYLPESQLEYLDLQFNHFDISGVRPLVASLEHNSYLQELLLWNAGSSHGATRTKMEEVLLPMKHWLRLNRSGRRAIAILPTNPKGSAWPVILERADGVYTVNALFHLLRERPDIVAQ
jgi:Ran GTPase-activating protein (RanGAP) involved in mRNA processing and transport